MQVIDEITRRPISQYNATKVVVGHIPGQVITGFTSHTENVQYCMFFVDGNFVSMPALFDYVKDILSFSNKRGCYFSTVDVPSSLRFVEEHEMGTGEFPYFFPKRYEAIESFNIFSGKQGVINKREYKLGNFLKYSFGLEFETSQGYIPEDICFRDGLIPLRDGSISGIEYSTVILNGNEGLSLLNQQIETLKRYTSFNKECSLHIHIGGFPLDSNKIYFLYRICKHIEEELEDLVPPKTFRTSEYKANGKDYCKLLGSYRSFDQMYEHIVGRKFFKDFTQPHPNDLRREAKWRIPTRYYWVNFVNILCYKVNKTIEFRFLRPTYCFNKILIWLYIFNAILSYAEKATSIDECMVTLETIIKAVYPESIYELVMTGIGGLMVQRNIQVRDEDYIGNNTSMEEPLYSNFDL